MLRTIKKVVAYLKNKQLQAKRLEQNRLQVKLILKDF